MVRISAVIHVGANGTVVETIVIGRKHAVNYAKGNDGPVMTTPTAAFAAIESDFELLDDWEDRYRYVIELGRRLAPLPDGEKSEANKVRGCASQVWITSRPAPDGREPALEFAGQSDSHIVQGLIAILLALVNGRSAREVAAMDIHARFAALGLKEHLTPQRSNGLVSMVERIKSDVAHLAS
jgi:cysteine desulfuration protein SufE